MGLLLLATLATAFFAGPEIAALVFMGGISVKVTEQHYARLEQARTSTAARTVANNTGSNWVGLSKYGIYIKPYAMGPRCLVGDRGVNFLEECPMERSAQTPFLQGHCNATSRADYWVSVPP